MSEETNKFGSYLRGLREKKGLSLRDVEATVKGVRLSNSYLYQIERGDRNPPRIGILRELSRVYQVPVEDVLVRAGYTDLIVKEKNVSTVGHTIEHQIERAFRYVCEDPDFQYGMKAQGEELSIEAKRFVIELYQSARPGIRLVLDLDFPKSDGDSEEEEDE